MKVSGAWMIVGFLLVGCTVRDAGVARVASAAKAGDQGWKSSFALTPRHLATTGRGAYVVLEPGHRLVLESGKEKLTITILDETEQVGPFATRVMEEREESDGALKEVSRNYVAISKGTGDLYYFGEDVDMYRDGKVTAHGGSWRAGKDGARPGLLVPGRPKVGMRYHQEVAPGKAMDRAEVISVRETLTTPAGTFEDCLRTEESTPLEPGIREYKTYAPGIGLIQDERLLLTWHGFAQR